MVTQRWCVVRCSVVAASLLWCAKKYVAANGAGAGAGVDRSFLQRTENSNATMSIDEVKRLGFKKVLRFLLAIVCAVLVSISVVSVFVYLRFTLFNIDLNL